MRVSSGSLEHELRFKKFNPLPDVKILALSKLKAFADDKMNVNHYNKLLLLLQYFYSKCLSFETEKDFIRDFCKQMAKFFNPPH